MLMGADMYLEQSELLTILDGLFFVITALIEENNLIPGYRIRLH